MPRTVPIAVLLLLLAVNAVVSCGKVTSDPPKSIGYLRIANTLYASPQYLDSVEVGVAVQGELSSEETCWLGIWNSTQSQGSSPVWCGHEFYTRSSTKVFHPVIRDEGVYYLKAGLCVYFTDECVDTPAVDLEGPVTIWVGAGYFPRRMTIEYDCQRSYNTLSANTLTKFNTAFNPCSTSVTIVKSDTTLADSVFSSFEKMRFFVSTNYNTAFHKMYIIGIADQSPRASSIGPTATGITIATGAYGEPYGATIMFKRFIDSVYSHAPFSWDAQTIQEGTNKCMIHELGHQRAGLEHTDSFPQNHVAGSPCVMLPGLACLPDHSLAPGWDRFCDSCVAKIKRVSW